MSVTYAEKVEYVISELNRISPELGVRFKIILNKRVDELTDSDKKLLILARYLLNPISEGRDIRSKAKRGAITVK